MENSDTMKTAKHEAEMSNFEFYLTLKPNLAHFDLETMPNADKKRQQERQQWFDFCFNEKSEGDSLRLELFDATQEKERMFQAYQNGAELDPKQVAELQKWHDFCCDENGVISFEKAEIYENIQKRHQKVYNSEKNTTLKSPEKKPEQGPCF